MMAVTGAIIVLSRLAGIIAGFRRSLASGERTKINRMGWVFELVEPYFTRSYIS